MSQVHVCGKCSGEFETDEQYCDHQCETTGFTPKQAENLGEEFAAVQQAAIERGEARKVEAAA